MVNINSYYAAKIAENDIKKKVHRDAVGGLWEEIGELTFQFRVNKANIKPEMKILDLGCGCFRCGIKIIEYLHPTNYYAIDLSEDLIKAGFAELRKYGIENKVTQKNVHITEDFDAEVFKVKFDLVLAQSLWTHLPFNHIQRSLAAVEKVLTSEGMFYTTFFYVQKIMTYLNHTEMISEVSLHIVIKILTITEKMILYTSSNKLDYH